MLAFVTYSAALSKEQNRELPRAPREQGDTWEIKIKCNIYLFRIISFSGFRCSPTTGVVSEKLRKIPQRRF